MLYGLTAFAVVRGELQTAHELSDQLLRLAQNASDSALLVMAHRGMGTTLFFCGQFAVAREHFEQVLALYDLQQHRSLRFLYATDPKVACLCFLAQTLWYLGYPAQAFARIQEALSLVQELASRPHSWAGALCNVAWLHQHCCDVRVTQVQAEAVIALATEQGFAPVLAIGHICRGWALAEQSQLEAGLTEMREALAAYRATEANNLMPYHLALLGEVYGKAGQIDNGLAALTEALEIVTRTGERQREAELYRLKGELTLVQSRVQGLAASVTMSSKRRARRVGIAHHDVHMSEAGTVGGAHPTREAEAEACFWKAIEVARKQQAKSLELRAVMSLSRLWLRQGKKRNARQMLATIYGWFTEGFDTADLQEAKALLDDLA
jgi:predicted ATPase